MCVTWDASFNFAKPIKHKEAELLSLDEIAERAQQVDRGATEVCIQGGLHPQIGAIFIAILFWLSNHAYQRCISMPFPV